MKVWVVVAREEWNETVDVLGARASVLAAVDIAQTALTAKGNRWALVTLDGWDTDGGPRISCYQVSADHEVRCDRCPDVAVVTGLADLAGVATPVPVPPPG